VQSEVRDLFGFTSKSTIGSKDMTPRDETSAKMKATMLTFCDTKLHKIVASYAAYE